MKRRSSISISESELEEFMKVLTDSLGEEWLNADTNHPLQVLWKRNDELATNELYSLAYAIKVLSEIDPSWTRKQIDTVKVKDRNNSQGAIFEFLGLNMIHNPTEHPVKPTKLNQAGYDGLLTKSDSSEIRVSIKNYGISSFQRSFEKKAKSVETKMIGLLKKYKYPPVQILLDFPDSYPNDRDWKMLEDRLDGIFKSQRTADEPFTALVEPLDPKVELSRENNRKIFIITVYPFKVKEKEFHEKFHSYTLMISARYHKNEHQNLYSKMDNACSNLAKHSASEDEHVTNSLLLHLPETISLDQCTKWLDDYFEEFPNKPISIVFLYQPTVAVILETNQTAINHCFKFYLRKGKKINGNYKFCIPVGLISNESTKMLYIAEFPNGQKQTIPLEDRYIYQHGEHYMKMKPDGKGRFQGNIKKLGSGVHTSVVLEIPGQKETAIIHGRFAPSDELLIL
ncbi:MAG: hypothetical protein AAF600_17765 [Bacteroidota bacterium]